MTPASLRLGPFLAVAAALTVPQVSADVVTHWNKVATDVTLAAAIDPLAESRILAIVQIAVHDAVNALDRKYDPYLFRTSVPGTAPEAAVASATREVLLALAPGQKAAIEAKKAEWKQKMQERRQKRQQNPATSNTSLEG